MEEAAFDFLLLVETAAGAPVCVFGLIVVHADFMVFIFQSHRLLNAVDFRKTNLEIMFADKQESYNIEVGCIFAHHF